MNPLAPILVTLRVALLGAVGVATCASIGGCTPKRKGYEKVGRAMVRRHGPAQCDPKIDLPACKGTEEVLSCKGDSDCTGGPHGKCITGPAHFGPSAGPGEMCRCAYACSGDADCKTGEVCVCGDALAGRSQCVAASCTGDGDCSSGDCVVSSYHDGCDQRSFVLCTSSGDGCRSNEDCGKGESCAYDDRGVDKGSIRCRARPCMIGRPLVVGGRAATSVGRARTDWGAGEDPGERGLDLPPRARERIAAHWLSNAAMEHASVASFARFSLQLMALGAPPALLAAAQRAALDEIEHAKLAYGIARSYGAAAWGPSELLAAVAPIDSDVRAVVRALVIEGCVGEACGAAEAALLATCAADEGLSAALRTIAADERAHAELAYRALAWLVSNFGGARGVARAALDEAMRDAGRNDVAFADETSRHGVLPEAAQRALRRAVLEEVVAPATLAALSPCGAGRTTSSGPREDPRPSRRTPTRRVRRVESTRPPEP